MASAGKGNVIGDWSALLPELLTSIAKRMHSYEDFVAFGGVCRSWRSVAVKDNFNHSASSSIQIPWLMLAEEEEGGCIREIRAFASLTKGGMIHRVDLPEARGRHCISSLGWLITTDDHGNTELLHPLSRVRIRIPLPHPTSYRYYLEGGEMNSDKFLIRRAVLSASPSLTDDYVLMVILGCNCYAAFWRPGNNVWTLVEEPHPSVCLDVIYYKHQFYAINRGFDRGILLLCNPNSDTAQIVGHVPHYATAFRDENAYLVESSAGDLLLVNRERDFYYEDDDDYETYWTCSFRIYKFDSTDMNKWQEINDLQGGSIFVGHSAAAAVPATAAGVKPNCVYFTDDYTDEYSIADNLIGGKDMGIFDLQTRTSEHLSIVSTPLNNYCPPIWVFPSF